MKSPHPREQPEISHSASEASAASIASQLHASYGASPNQFQLGIAFGALRSGTLESQAAFDAAAWFRRALTWAKQQSFSCVCLDATMPGMRPRELDASAKREIAVLLRRHDLSLAGIDCFVPTDHLVGASQARAFAAIEGAMMLCASLRKVWCESPPVGVRAEAQPGACVVARFPATLDAAAASHLAISAKRAAVVIADVSQPSVFAACGEQSGWGTVLSPSSDTLHEQAAIDAFTTVVLAAHNLTQARIPAAMSKEAAAIQTYLSLLHVRGFGGAVVVG